MPASPERRKVVVIFHDSVLGGSVRSVVRLIPLLEDRGWRFSFWVDKPSPLFDDLTERGYEVDGAPRLIAWTLPELRLPPGPRARLAGTPRYLRRLLSFLRSQAPALIHANSITVLPEALVAKRSGAPVLVHVHEMVQTRIRGSIARYFVRRLDALVAVSVASGRAIAGRRSLPRIIHEAASVPEQPVPVRSDPHPFVIGTLGVVSPRKGSDLFVDAADAVLRERSDIEFRLVGGLTDPLDVEWGREVIHRAKAAGIVYKPHVDPQAEFRTWDGFVLPSRRDPFPIAMLEAMASGLPVIGTRVDGLVEQITPECGRLVPPLDPDSLAHAMVWLSELDAQKRGAMGAAGRKRVTSNFTLDRQAAEFHQVYLELAQRR